VYPPKARNFPIGLAMNKNLTLQMGNCNHRKYIPLLIEKVRLGVVDPLEVLTQTEPLISAIDAYKAFDQRLSGWMKVELLPGAKAKNSSAAAEI
jgi:threonine dehydrogenase-like Zn-dependent dehydrogenase